jgi:hypothetical protein
MLVQQNHEMEVLERRTQHEHGATSMNPGQVRCIAAQELQHLFLNQGLSCL